MTIRPTTLTVNVVRPDGTPAFTNPRHLRVGIRGRASGQFAVARHGKAIPVIDFLNETTAVVDLTAHRFDIGDTRPGKMADIGKGTAKPAAPAAAAMLSTPVPTKGKHKGKGKVADKAETVSVADALAKLAAA